MPRLSIIEKSGYADQVRKWVAAGWSCRDIAAWLTRHGVTVSHAAVWRFRSRREMSPNLRPMPDSPDWQIEASKHWLVLVDRFIGSIVAAASKANIELVSDHERALAQLALTLTEYVLEVVREHPDLAFTHDAVAGRPSPPITPNARTTVC